MNASLYRQGMKLAKECGLLVFAHCEDITMVEGGVMNADENAGEDMPTDENANEGAE